MKMMVVQLIKNPKMPRSCRYLNNSIAGKGLFKVENNHIIIQYYQMEFKNPRKDSYNNYYLYELRGKIVDSTTFVMTEKINYRNNETQKITLEFKYTKDPNLPKIDNIL